MLVVHLRQNSDTLTSLESWGGKRVLETRPLQRFPTAQYRKLKVATIYGMMILRAQEEVVEAQGWVLA